jgi:DNA polymerase-3 subunit chi
VAQARAYWKEWDAAGHELIYHQQTERGGWQEKARNKKGEQDAQG